MPLNSVRMILLVLLPILLITQVANGMVIVNNTSTSTVSVYDANTTIIIDPLKPTEYTYFPLESAGPDLFQIEKYTATGKVSAFNLTVEDGYTLLLFTKAHKLLYSRAISKVATATPPSNSAGAPVAGG